MNRRHPGAEGKLAETSITHYTATLRLWKFRLRGHECKNFFKMGGESSLAACEEMAVDGFIAVPIHGIRQWESE